MDFLADLCAQAPAVVAAVQRAFGLTIAASAIELVPLPRGCLRLLEARTSAPNTIDSPTIFECEIFASILAIGIRQPSSSGIQHS